LTASCKTCPASPHCPRSSKAPHQGKEEQSGEREEEREYTVCIALVSPNARFATSDGWVAPSHSISPWKTIHSNLYIPIQFYNNLTGSKVPKESEMSMALL